MISDKAHLILPYHRELDLLERSAAGRAKIGTTSRGIGRPMKTRLPAAVYASATSPTRDALREAVKHNVAARNRIISRYRGTTLDARSRSLTKCQLR